MGGLFIIAGLVGGTLLFGDLTNRYVLLALWVVGGLDARRGGRRSGQAAHARQRPFGPERNSPGNSWWPPSPAVLLYRDHAATARRTGVAAAAWSAAASRLGLWFIPLAMLVIVGSSNAVNLTDGLDGLAGGCLLLRHGGHDRW